MKQQGAAGLAEWEISKLVKDDQIHPHQRQRGAAGLAFALFLLKDVDQIDGRVEAHPFSVRSDAVHRDGGGQVRLSRSGAADEDRILGRVGERQRRQLPHQALIDLARLEVEPGQVSMHWKFGGAELMGDRKDSYVNE